MDRYEEFFYEKLPMWLGIATALLIVFAAGVQVGQYDKEYRSCLEYNHE